MGVAEVIIAIIFLFIVIKALNTYSKFWLNENLIKDMKKELINLFVPEIKQVHNDQIVLIEMHKSALMSDDKLVRENAIDKILEKSHKSSLELDQRLKKFGLDV